MAVKFRPSQEAIIEGYHGGLMGISAVPGSGKTFTLSHLAARLVGELARDGLEKEQEVLIVTFSNSAVNGFRKRIADILQTERSLLPYVGYRVRTLHGLAHDIVRERPTLVGLADDFQIIDESVAFAIRDDIVKTLLQSSDWGDRLFEYYRSPMLEENNAKRVRRRDFIDSMANIAQRFIQQAKDKQLTPKQIEAFLAERDEAFDLARFANAVYTDYQWSLTIRGAVDFDDLVRLSLETLQVDGVYRDNLRERWPYILEDEAQDSSLLQEEMLSILSGDRNWVRVGDPNQAINTTFTSADSSLLANFLDNPNVQAQALPVSGRSGQPIIDMANELVYWTTGQHPAPELRPSFFPQRIEPTTKDDPQQNPTLDECNLHIHYTNGQNITPEQELDLIAGSLRKWLPDNQHQTVAVLVPENSRGFKLTEKLREFDIPYEELLRSTTSTRTTVAYLQKILLYLASPHEPRLLSQLFRDVWTPLHEIDDTVAVETLTKALARTRQIEAVVWPFEAVDLQDILNLPNDFPLLSELGDFLFYIRQWLEGLSLPVDQLVLTISQEIFREPIDLALAYKIAVFLRGISQEKASSGLTELATELTAIVENQRRFLGFDDSAEGFEATPGVVTVSTMHASKGLEWDRVYLMAVSNYGFPALQSYDSYIGERWFLRDNLNLEAELLAQLDILTRPHAEYTEGEASLDFRVSYSAERLRLLYVAITRARRELIITWNIGRYWNEGAVNSLALPLMPFVS